MPKTSRFTSPSSSAKDSTSSARIRCSSLTKSALLAAMAVGVLGAGQAEALTISLYNSFDYGNSTYRSYLADQEISWTTASNYATGVTATGLTGPALGGLWNLVSINSAAENAAIFSNINDPQLWTVSQGFSWGPWIGLSQQGQTCEPGNPAQGSCGGWNWADGTTVFSNGYSSWEIFQPDNAFALQGGEHWGNFFASSSNRAATWNDNPNNPSSNTPPWDVVSFVVEAPAAVPGPIPVLGAAAAFGFSRKLRKRIKVSKAVGAAVTDA
jgi:hypothetical protein